MTSVLISGSNGFIGKNLKLHLKENSDYDLLEFNRSDNLDYLEDCLIRADIIIHLAGINRSESKEEFVQGNVGLSASLVDILKKHSLKKPIIFASSTHVRSNEKLNAHLDYCETKKKAEEILIQYSESATSGLRILDLPSIFGKWAKPFYNSFVATLCYSIANGKSYKIDDPSKKVKLLHIDDLVAEIYLLVESFIKNQHTNIKKVTFKDEYSITLCDLERKLKAFYKMRKKLHVGEYGSGFDRAIYSTLISYFNPENFFYESYPIFDERGYFVEFVKTNNSGQFSCINVPVGQVRGQHYHHTKTEKFLIAKGVAKINFRCLNSGEEYSKVIDAPNCIIDTIPGWIHNIENIGSEDLIVLIWSNEVFQKDKPDTISINF
tara:strand:- start:551 stop:1687 length:1137 start_codon:yes stop_codon:yes gene_type:complete